MASTFTTARQRRTFNSSKTPQKSSPTTSSKSQPTAPGKTTLAGIAQATGGKIKGDRVEYFEYGDSPDNPGRKAKFTKYARAGDPIPGATSGTVPDVPTNAEQADMGQPEIPSAVQAVQPPGNITDPLTGKTFAPDAQGKYSAGGELPIAQKYKKGLQTAQASNAPVPTTTGEGQSLVAQSVPPPQDTQSQVKVDTLFQEDPVLKQITDSFTELMSPPKQRESLVSEYKKMLKSSGLNDINEELIDTQRIIDGTEDDIRSEVTAAHGFATESQVLAMANARNKSLIKNYNALLATRDSIQQNLNMMMSLTQADRQAADQRLSQQLQVGQVILNYRDKMQANAREAFNNTIKAIGYDGLYESTQGDPYQMGLIEKTLGLTPGQLQIASARAKEERQQQFDDVSLDRELKRASLANTYSQIAERNNSTNSYGTISGKPQNATQSAANGYADRLNESNIVLDMLGSKFTGKLAYGGKLPNSLQSGDRQSYEQAKKNFVTAVLRRESGASIAPTEFKTAEEIYFPIAGDSEETIKQKENTRNTVINNFYREADVNRPVLPGQIVESDGKRYKVGADGETLTEMK